MHAGSLVVLIAQHQCVAIVNMGQHVGVAWNFALELNQLAESILGVLELRLCRLSLVLPLIGPGQVAFDNCKLFKQANLFLVRRGFLDLLGN